MVNVPMRDVAARLRRSEAWVAAELCAAGIRSTDYHIYSLTIDELEALVAHLRSKWNRQNERKAITSPSPQAPILPGAAPRELGSALRSTSRQFEAILSRLPTNWWREQE